MDTAKATIGEGIYSAKDMSEILRIPLRRCRYWFQAYLKDKLSSITGYQYHFSDVDGVFVNFKTLLQLYVFEELRKRGHNTKSIIEAYSLLSKRYGTPYPFTSENIISSGKDILFEENDMYISANTKLQVNLLEIVKPFSVKIDFDNNGVATKFYPIGRDKNIVIDPKIQFGSPVFNGTRLNTKVIYDLHLAGEEHEVISNIYNISTSHIQDAIEFYSDAA